MIDFLYRRLSRQSRHPSLEELLLYVDEEVKPKGHNRIEAHLRICWSCRVQRERIESLISAFVKDQKTFLSESPSFPEGAIPKFETRLRRLASDSRKPLLSSRLFTTLVETASYAGPWRGLACCVVLIVASVFIVRLSSVPPVSAKEVLQQSRRAESQRIRQVIDPVIYQELRVRRKSAGRKQEDVVTWEQWNDTSNNRFKARIEDASGVRFLLPLKGDARPAQNLRSAPLSLPPILVELDQIYRSSHMDSRQPLSPASYESWRSTIRRQSEKVGEARLTDGSRALALATTATGPFAPNQIIKAELVVRAEDWHPVEQRLKVQGENETRDYELTETTFQVVSLNSLSPLIFPDLTPVYPSPVAVVPPPQAPAPNAVPVPSAAELLASEIEASYALHRLKACRGEQIEVSRNSSGRIQVQGIVDTAERKEELLGVLQSLANVSVTIQTNEEAESSQSQGPISSKASQGVSLSTEYKVTVQTDKLPIQDLLKPYLAQHPTAAFFEERQNKNEPIGDNAKIAWLSYKTVSLSEAALSEVWALRRLAEGYPLGETSHLQARPQLLLETMVRDHLAELRRTISRSRTLLEPILASLLAEKALPESEHQSGRPEQPPVETPSWKNKTLLVFGTVEKIDAFIHGLFSTPGLPADQTEGATRELLSALHRCEEEVDRLEAAVAQAFLADADSISLKHQPE